MNYLKWSFLLFLLSIVFLGGCSTTLDPYSDEERASNASVGAGVGALSGAMIGALVGNSKGALLGAGVGAIAGGAIGNNIDEQEGMLRDYLRNSGVKVIRHAADIQIIMQSDITFANDSAEINPGFYETLDAVALVLRRFNRTLINIAGYTSNTGSVMHNQILSEERACSVADYLVSKGIRPGRLVTVGYGVRFPIASNSTAAGRSLNRRVEITIRSLRDF